MTYTISAPAYEPITLALAKEWLKVDTSAEDATIGALIQAAREFAENHTGQLWAQRTVTEYLDEWPGYVICPAFGRVQAISDVSVILDGASTYTAVSTTAYVTDTVSIPARIVLRAGQSWPTLETRPNAVKITYTVGFASISDVPESIKTAMRLLLAFWYENREDIGTPKHERAAKNLLLTQKVYHI